MTLNVLSDVLSFPHQLESSCIQRVFTQRAKEVKQRCSLYDLIVSEWKAMNLSIRSMNNGDVRQRRQYRSSKENPLIRLIPNRDRTAQTRRLLDRAIVAAARELPPNHKPVALTPSRWVWQLTASYHLTHSTPRLMSEAAERFATAGRWSLAQWADEKAHEEQGHDQLALLDIQSMGYDAAEIVKAIVPAGAVALLDLFRQSVRSPDPIGCLGYCYTMERLAMTITAEHIQSVEAILPFGIDATRCLRVHSGLGSDVKHVEETLQTISELTEAERTNIAIACYETASLYFGSLQQAPIPEEELQKLLSGLRI